MSYYRSVECTHIHLFFNSINEVLFTNLNILQQKKSLHTICTYVVIHLYHVHITVLSLGWFDSQGYALNMWYDQYLKRGKLLTSKLIKIFIDSLDWRYFFVTSIMYGWYNDLKLVSKYNIPLDWMLTDVFFYC